MDQEEIEDVDAQPFHTVVEGGQRPIVSVLAVYQFRGDEDRMSERAMASPTPFSFRYP